MTWERRRDDSITDGVEHNRVGSGIEAKHPSLVSTESQRLKDVKVPATSPRLRKSASGAYLELIRRLRR